MKIVGMMLARDEGWCIGLTLPVALSWCDEVIVLDHASSDATGEIARHIAREHPGRVHVLEHTGAFNEAQMRQRLLDHARTRQMTHGAIIDADEMLTANLAAAARQFVPRVGPGQIPCIPMISPWEGLERHRVDPAFARKFIGVWFADHPSLQYRGESDGYHYHQRHPRGLAITHWHALPFGGGGGWHLQTITQRRLAVKAACYKVLERVHYPGRHSAEQLREMYDWTIRAVPQLASTPEHWLGDHPALACGALDLAAEPWQLHEARRLIETHPPELFADLDLQAVA